MEKKGKGTEWNGREGKKGYYPQKQQAKMRVIKKYRQKRREEK